jgi:hypothetical protein
MAETPREMLTKAAFGSPSKEMALSRIAAALKEAEAALRRNPGDEEAALQRAVAISYRGKLTRSRADLIAARRAFESIVAADPRNAEAQLALGGWHLGAVAELGPLVARTALGARANAGVAALDRAMSLSGGRALFPAFASLTYIRLNPKDLAKPRQLAQAAVDAKTPEPMDRLMQRQAAALLNVLRAGNGKAAAEAADRLLPFGRLK